MENTNNQATATTTDPINEMRNAALKSIAEDLIVVKSVDCILRAKKTVEAISSIAEGSAEDSPLNYLKKRAEWTISQLPEQNSSVRECDQILHALSKEIKAYLES